MQLVMSVWTLFGHELLINGHIIYKLEFSLLHMFLDGTASFINEQF